MKGGRGCYLVKSHGVEPQLTFAIEYNTALTVSTGPPQREELRHEPADPVRAISKVLTLELHLVQGLITARLKDRPHKAGRLGHPRFPTPIIRLVHSLNP